MNKATEPAKLEKAATEALLRAAGTNAEMSELAAAFSLVKERITRRITDYEHNTHQIRADVRDHIARRRTALARLTAPAPAKSEKDRTFSGRLVDEQDGEPIPYTRIRIMDLDRKDHDQLGVAITDSMGNFSLAFSAKQFDDPDARPELYCEVLDENDHVLVRTRRSMVEKTPTHAWVRIPVDAQQLPAAVRKSKGALLRVYEADDRRLSRAATITGFPKESRRSPSVTVASGHNPTDRVSAAGAKTPKRKQSRAADTGRRLTDITGLGKGYERRLNEHNIKSIRALATEKPERIAQTLRVNKAKADAFIREANALL